MKSTGIVRRIDDLGRVVVPKEIRRNLDIAEGDPMEIYVDGDRIMLRKYEAAVDSPKALIRELLENGNSPELLERMREAVR